MVTRVYIVRHCEARANVSDIFQGHTDGDITEKGERQLEKLAERMKDVHIDAIYSSPLIRAMKTAQTVNRYHRLEIIPDRDFMEINGGEYEGRTWTEIDKALPGVHTLWDNNFANFYSEKGEKMSDVFRRVSEGITRIVRENRGKTVLIASHGAAIRNLTCFLRGIRLENISDVGWVDNTGICCYDFDESMNVTAVLFNDCAHIMSDPLTQPHRMTCCVEPD